MKNVSTENVKKSDINKEKKRADLLNSAYELFTTVGFSSTTISQIAKNAGVGKGTFYLYFDSKEEIGNILITQKSSELLYKAITEIKNHCAKTNERLSVCDKIIFITDYIITTLSKDMALLKYISKYLSWGLFSVPFLHCEEKDILVDFRTFTKVLLEKDGIVIKNLDMVIFTILELLNSTCYNVILHGEPVSFSDYKPYLFNCIRLIVNDAIKE
ncbi:TetR/AcrR family transcriptional regulator [Eubacteriales bacterium KG127]